VAVSCLWYDMVIRTFSVNSRGKGTRTRQKKMTVEQAAAVLLVTVVIPISLYWNSASEKGMILGSKGSCRTDCHKERPPHYRRDKDTSRGKEHVGGNISNQRTRSPPWTDLQHFFPNSEDMGTSRMTNSIVELSRWPNVTFFQKEGPQQRKRYEI
jgi:hypothetical protein